MTKRGALILSAILTAFILVLVGGVMARLLPADRSPAEDPSQPSAAREPLPSGLATTPGSPPAALPRGASLAPEQATAIATRLVPAARPTGTPELVSFEGALAYEVQLDRGPVYVDASSGRLLHDGTRQNAASGRIRARHDDDDDDEHEEHERKSHSRSREPHEEHDNDV